MSTKCSTIAFLGLVLTIFLTLSIVSGAGTGTTHDSQVTQDIDPGDSNTYLPTSELLSSYLDGMSNGLDTPVYSEDTTKSGQANWIHPMPLQFIKNAGQADPSVQFEIVTEAGSVFFTGQRTVFALSSSGNTEVLAHQFVGATGTPVVEGVNPSSGKVNFLIGSSPDTWYTNIETFQGIRYQNLYPGIDLVYKGSDGNLKSEFILSPNSDPATIRIRYSGVTGITRQSDGSLLVSTPVGSYTENAPVAYQVINGQQVNVPVNYRVTSPNEVGFSIGTYDKTRELVIDPVMKYGIYLAGFGVADAKAVGKDAAGRAYVAGTTYPGFTLAGSGEVQSRGGTDAIVVKLNAAGSAPEYITYIGGSQNDGANGMVVDGTGNVYITGFTNSTNFPVVNPVQGTLRGSSNAFMAKIGPAGDNIEYSTYLGGSKVDIGNAIAVDNQGDAYITGTTNSPDFPVINEFQTSRLTGGQSAFVSKFGQAGSPLIYSGYIGGNAPTSGLGLAVDGAGNAYVTGETFALLDFPIKNAFQSVNQLRGDAFVTKIAPNGGSPVYSTYIGGNGYDSGASIAVDSEGAAYITGTTGSSNFPLKYPVQNRMAGVLDAFILKLKPDGSGLLYSTYLGGMGTDRGMSISLNQNNDAYVSGWTYSLSFPLVNPYQSKYGGGAGDAFVAKLINSGTSYEYVTYLGGNARDTGASISADDTGLAYIAGNTSSTNFPTVNPFPNPPGIMGGYVIVLSDTLIPPTPPVAEFTANTTSGMMTLSVQFTDQSTGSPTSWQWDFGDETGSSEKNPVHFYSSPGIYTVSLTAGNAYGEDTIVKQDYIEVLGPIGGDKGYYLVHSNVDGATVWFDSTEKGTITNGTLLVEVYVTGSPYYNFTVGKEGYNTLTQPITEHPGKDETVNLYANLTPITEPLAADFGANTTSGLTPLPVGFIDLSTGDPISWNWSFGDGSYSTEQHPDHVYMTQGLYTVSLTVGNGTTTDTRVRPDFINVTGCGEVGHFLVHSNAEGATVTFDNEVQGVISDGTLLVTVCLTSPHFTTYTVEKDGYYPLTQDLTQYPEKDQTIDLYANLTPIVVPPVADFTADPESGLTPLHVQLTDTSTGIPTSWYWTFGDGNSSTEQDPLYTYNIPGQYTVTLVAYNSAGNSTKTKYELINVTGCGELGYFLVHSNAEGATVTFDNEVQGVISNGTLLVTVCLTTPHYSNYTVEKDGYYPLTQDLTQYPGKDQTIDLYANLTPIVVAPVADFTADPESGLTPLHVQFTDTSTGVPTSWYWTFGDGHSSTEQDPLYTYNIPGQYTVTLVAYNSAGNSTKTKYEFINVTGCGEIGYFRVHSNAEGATVKFDNEIKGVISNGTLLVPVCLTTPPYTNFTVEKDGYHPLTQDLTQYPGKDQTIDLYANLTPIVVPPVADFTADPDTGLTPLHVQFTDTSTGVPTSWYWTFGDGNSSTAQNPLYTYNIPGRYTVTLVAYNSAGNSTRSKYEFINVTGCGEIGYFRVHSNAEDATVKFDSEIKGVISNGTLLVPVCLTTPPYTNYTVEKDGYHPLTQDITQYPTKGQIIDLYANLTPIVVPPVADFMGSPRTGAPPMTVHFVDLSTGVPVTWNWNFGDGSTSTEKNPVHTYYEQGRFNVSLTVTNSAGTDTLLVQNYIDTTGTPTPPPISDFTSNVTGGFIPLSVQFTDKSIGYVEYREWDFGDDSPISHEQNPVHVYSEPGSYDVTLFVQNGAGSMSFTQLNYINATGSGLPVANFVANTTSGQYPMTVQFTDTSTGFPDSWTWSFGDNTGSAQKNPVHTYLQPGTYTVSLGVTNSIGSGWTQKPGYIQVHQESEYFTVNAGAGSNGTISPSGTILVWAGENQTFNINPETGYSVLGVLVDNVQVGPLAQYTFTDVRSSHSIYATFKKNAGNSYTINAVANGAGTVTPSGPVQVTPGGNQSFNFTPSNGYSLIQLQVDGTNVAIANTYEFTNVSADHTLTATFGLPVYGGGGGGSSGGGGGTGGSSYGGGGGGGGSYSSGTTTNTTNTSVDNLKSGSTGAGSIGSTDSSGEGTLPVATRLVTTVATEAMQTPEVTTVPETTSPPAAATTPPSGPAPVWSKVPMNLVLPLVIIIIIVLLAIAGYFLYQRRKKADEFFGQK